MEGYRRVAAGIVEKDGQVLIGKKKHAPGHFLSDEWHIPGGKVQLNETFEQGLEREMREETGLEIRVESLLGEHIDEANNRRIKWYLCTPVKGELKPCDDIVDAEFVPKEEVLSHLNRAVSTMPPKVLEYFRS